MLSFVVLISDGNPILALLPDLFYLINAVEHRKKKRDSSTIAVFFIFLLLNENRWKSVFSPPYLFRPKTTHLLTAALFRTQSYLKETLSHYRYNVPYTWILKISVSWMIGVSRNTAVSRATFHSMNSRSRVVRSKAKGGSEARYDAPKCLAGKKSSTQSRYDVSSESSPGELTP